MQVGLPRRSGEGTLGVRAGTLHRVRGSHHDHAVRGCCRRFRTVERSARGNCRSRAPNSAAGGGCRAGAHRAPSAPTASACAGPSDYSGPAGCHRAPRGAGSRCTDDCAASTSDGNRATGSGCSGSGCSGSACSGSGCSGSGCSRSGCSRSGRSRSGRSPRSTAGGSTRGSRVRRPGNSAEPVGAARARRIARGSAPGRTVRSSAVHRTGKASRRVP